MRAATMLAGVDWHQLARLIDEENFGPTTLRKLTSESTGTKRKAVFRRTAEATGLPESFFTADLGELGPSQQPAAGDDLPAIVRRLEDRVREIQAQLAVLEAEVHQQTSAASKPSESPQRGQQP